MKLLIGRLEDTADAPVRNSPRRWGFRAELDGARGRDPGRRRVASIQTGFEPATNRPAASRTSARTKVETEVSNETSTGPASKALTGIDV